MSAALPMLDIDDDEGIALLQLSNPPLNLLTAAARTRLIEISHELAVDSTVRVVLLSGTGRCFSAGSDIHEFPHDAARGRERARLEHQCVNALERLPQPVVAALHGHVLGGGLELALAADLRIAADTSVFGFPEVQLGVFPSGGGTFRARRDVGLARAMELMLLGETIDAEESHRLGLVNRLTSAEQVQAEAYRIATAIATRPRLATRAIKEALRASDQNTDATEERLIAELFTSHDAQEGVAAFLGKRVPRFEHR